MALFISPIPYLLQPSTSSLYLGVWLFVAGFFFLISHMSESIWACVCVCVCACVCVCVCHFFLIDLFISGPTGCIYNLAAKNNDAVTWGCIYVFELMFYFLQINTQKWDYCIIW